MSKKSHIFPQRNYNNPKYNDNNIKSNKKFYNFKVFKFFNSNGADKKKRNNNI